MTDESMSYLEALKEIKRLKEALEQQPCEDCISRQAVIEITAETGALETQSRVRELPSVTPKEKTAKWIYKQGIFGAVYCSKCDFELKTNNTKYCPNCGCQMRGGTDGKDANNG